MAANRTTPSSSQRSDADAAAVTRALRLRVIILAILLVPLGILAMRAALTPQTTDFLCYWTGARLAIERADPYDAGQWARATSAVTVDMFGVAREGNCPGTYRYPLTTAVAMMPLGALPLAIAALIWQAIFVFAAGSGVALIARAAGSRPADGLALMVLVGASQPFEQSVIGAQFGGLMLLAVGLLAENARGTPSVAVGTLIAALKPQSIPFAVLLRSSRMDRAAIGAVAIPVLALIVASLVLDPAWPGRWAGALVGQRGEMVGVSKTLWTLGSEAGVAALGPGLAGLAVVALGAASRRATRLDLLDLLAVALLAWQLIVPYGLSGDQVAPLAAAWAAILRRALMPPTSAGLLAALIVVAGIVPWLLYAVRLDVQAVSGLTSINALAPLATAILLAAAIAIRPNVRRSAE